MGGRARGVLARHFAFLFICSSNMRCYVYMLYSNLATAAAILCLAWFSSASATATTAPGRGGSAGRSTLLLPDKLPTTGSTKPKLTITTSHNNSDSSLSPVLTWSTSQKSKDGKFNYDLGLDMEPLRGESLNAATNVFGRVSTKLLSRNVAFQEEGTEEGILSRLLRRQSTWDASVRADINVRNLPNIDTVDLALETSCEEQGVYLKTFASVRQGQQVELRQVEVSKTYNLKPNGRLTINPRYFPSDSGSGGYADAIMTYNRDDDVDTSVQLYATRERQRLTIARKIGTDVVISPSISSNGQVNVQWRHKIGDVSSVIANFSPRENINVHWTDGSWTCDIDAPIEENRIESTKVSIRRKIEFTGNE